MYYEKIRELLCTIPEIKEDIMEFKFGTIIKYFYKNNGVPDGEEEFQYIGYFKDIHGKYKHHFLSAEGKSIIDLEDLNKHGIIIGNDIELRHILWYASSRNTKIDCWSTLTIESDGEVRYEGNTICTLDNKKSMKDQEEKTLEAIYNFMK